LQTQGAEAIEGAIKVARKYGEVILIEEIKVITLGTSFHGRTIRHTKRLRVRKEFSHSKFSPYPDGFLL